MVHRRYGALNLARRQRREQLLYVRCSSLCEGACICVHTFVTFFVLEQMSICVLGKSWFLRADLGRILLKTGFYTK